mgnify:CR=1 FL=1
MDNKSISRKLKLIIQLMELHEENPFKIRSYQNAVITIDRAGLAARIVIDSIPEPSEACTTWNISGGLWNHPDTVFLSSQRSRFTIGSPCIGQ